MEEMRLRMEELERTVAMHSLGESNSKNPVIGVPMHPTGRECDGEGS